MNQETAAPVAFISYSHDSENHKRWVLEFAQELIEQHRIYVILDQWDLEPGDDIARFVREAMKRCDRVLMICTETYVEKAEAGQGGVGYEAMIVDGELIRDVGLRKFIPIVRQESKDICLPESVRTRRYINLSRGQNREEGMQKLRETMHSLPPPTRPSLGGGPLPAEALAAHALSPSQHSSDPSGLYDAALRLARTGDLPAWRRLVEKKKAEFPKLLNALRSDWEKRLPESDEDTIKLCIEGLRVLEPLFSVALAGVESGMDKFNRQAGLVHDLLEPTSWKSSGPIEIIDFPEIAVFVFQALLGTFAVYSDQPRLVFNLANQRVQRRYQSKSTRLWKSNGLIGRSYPSEQKLGKKWSFLWDISKHMPWVSEKLSGDRRFRECLCGHYFLLSFVEFVDRMRRKSHYSPGGLKQLSVPHYFITQPDEFSSGLRSILEEKKQLREYIHEKGVVLAVLREAWPEWVKRSEDFLKIFPHFPYEVRDDYKHFMEDLLT